MIEMIVAELNDETLITIANAYSREMDRTEPTHNLWEEMDKEFTVICNELERRGVVLSDNVICPQ